MIRSFLRASLSTGVRLAPRAPRALAPARAFSTVGATLSETDDDTPRPGKIYELRTVCFHLAPVDLGSAYQKISR